MTNLMRDSVDPGEMPGYEKLFRPQHPPHVALISLVAIRNVQFAELTWKRINQSTSKMKLQLGSWNEIRKL